MTMTKSQNGETGGAAGAEQDTFSAERDAAAASERAIQRRTDEREASGSNGGASKPHAMQAGARRYPEPPLPGQHLDKPGRESDMELKPMFDAPYYKGSGKLEGKVALITGGDSGIGRAVAVLFAREGADIAIAYLNEDEDAHKTRQAVEAEGRRCVTISGDVADPAFCRQAVERVVGELGGLDVLVNNAAFQEHAYDIAEIDDEHFDRTLKTNLYGYFYMARAAIPHLRPGSAIVMTGSVTGIEGAKQLIDYSMTKGGIHAFARALSGSLVEKGIRVNVVAPGPVWTPLNPVDKDGDSVSSFGQSTTMKRPAQPEELAPAYVFLASPACSSYITGEILPVIGGY